MKMITDSVYWRVVFWLVVCYMVYKRGLIFRNLMEEILLLFLEADKDTKGKIGGR